MVESTVLIIFCNATNNPTILNDVIMMIIFASSTSQPPIKEQKKFWASHNAYDVIGTNAKRIYYDAMMLMAMALNASIEDLKLLKPSKKLEDFHYSADDIVKVFNYNIRHAEFTGISVSIV